MRPRKTDPHLPPRVYRRHGRYYYVVNGKWHPLSRDLDESLILMKDIDPDNPHAATKTERDKMREAMKRVFHARRRGAAQRNIPFSITEDLVQRMAAKGKWRCSMTGIPFNLVKPKGKHRNPFGPSIDRIDNTKGYIEGNVRVVCLATNFAMNEWGEDVLQTLALGWFSKRVNRSDSPEF